jgi:HlyD family secretion protein
VQTGRLVGDRVEVVSGLTAEARIVVDGAGFLNDGDLVRIAAAPQAAAGTSKPNTAPAPAAPASAASK